MPERSELEALFLQHLGAIERMLAAIAQRSGLRGADQEEFGSWAKLRLIEGDYAALRKFRGESALMTYLAVVCGMLARDFRVQRWGRWRPSAAARQRGPLAVRLEALVYRDGYSLDEAAEVLRSAGETTRSTRALAQLLAELPVRVRVREVESTDDALAVHGAPESSDAIVLDEEAGGQWRTTADRLASALAVLPPIDQVVIRMYFWEGLTVAQIARGLSIQQKPLYRQMQRALARLRHELEASGVSLEQARALLERPSIDAPPGAGPSDLRSAAGVSASRARP